MHRLLKGFKFKIEYKESDLMDVNSNLDLYRLRDKFINDFEENLLTLKKDKYYKEMVFLCIGTDKVLGDCIGPLVGSKLNDYFDRYNKYDVYIYGSLEEPINYSNVNDIIKMINNNYENPCVIVVDAALSKRENIGKIFVSKGLTLLGSSLNKKKIEVGDISIKAVVGNDYKYSKLNLDELQNQPLNRIIKLSNIIANGIFETIKYV